MTAPVPSATSAATPAAPRRRFYVIGFLVLMAFDTLAQLSFKLAGDAALPLEASPAWLARVFGQPWIYGAFVGYVGAFFAWMTLLRHAPIGPAFAASHLEIVSVMLLSAWLFHAPLGAPQLVGALFIAAGIACLAVSETGETEETGNEVSQPGTAHTPTTAADSETLPTTLPAPPGPGAAAAAAAAAGLATAPHTTPPPHTGDHPRPPG